MVLPKPQGTDMIPPIFRGSFAAFKKLLIGSCCASLRLPIKSTLISAPPVNLHSVGAPYFWKP